MLDNVSPYCTTYFVVCSVAVTGAAATFSMLVRMTSVLPAVRVFACAGWTAPFIPTATRMIDKMLQASTTHADFVHVRMVLSLSFLRDQRRTLQVRTPRAWTGEEGKDLGWRDLRQIGAPDRLRVGTTREPQQDQAEKRDQSGANATLHPAPAISPAAARAAAVSAARAGRRPGKRRRRRHRCTIARQQRRRRRERGHISA